MTDLISNIKSDGIIMYLRRHMENAVRKVATGYRFMICALS